MTEEDAMTESTAEERPGDPDPPPPPPFDPDEDLMADVEGNKSAVSAYRREGAALRAAQEDRGHR